MFTTITRETIAALRTETHTTVALFLTAQGLPQDVIDQWGPAFGHHVAKTFRVRTGRANPDVTFERGTDGEWHRRWAYRTDDPLTGTAMHLALAHYREHRKAGPLFRRYALAA